MAAYCFENRTFVNVFWKAFKKHKSGLVSVAEVSVFAFYLKIWLVNPVALIVFSFFVFD